MAGNYGSNQYKNTAVLTANRGQLLIMLYERAIQHVKKASLSIDNKDVVAKGVAIGKAHDIINELANTLNHEVGGNIAGELERLYNFMTEQLVKANAFNTKEPLQAVQKIMEDLLGAWRIAVDQVNKGNAGSPPEKG